VLEYWIFIIIPPLHHSKVAIFWETILDEIEKVYKWHFELTTYALRAASANASAFSTAL
jgi:hypothetical protein